MSHYLNSLNSRSRWIHGCGSHASPVHSDTIISRTQHRVAPCRAYVSGAPVKIFKILLAGARLRVYSVSKASANVFGRASSVLERLDESPEFAARTRHMQKGSAACGRGSLKKTETKSAKRMNRVHRPRGANATQIRGLEWIPARG